jgi:hypothetical protein
MTEHVVVAVPLRAYPDVWLAVHLDPADVQALRDRGVDVKDAEQPHMQRARFASLAVAEGELAGDAMR